MFLSVPKLTFRQISPIVIYCFIVASSLKLYLYKLVRLHQGFVNFAIMRTEVPQREPYYITLTSTFFGGGGGGGGAGGVLL